MVYLNPLYSRLDRLAWPQALSSRKATATGQKKSLI